MQKKTLQNSVFRSKEHHKCIVRPVRATLRPQRHNPRIFVQTQCLGIWQSMVAYHWTINELPSVCHFTKQVFNFEKVVLLKICRVELLLYNKGDPRSSCNRQRWRRCVGLRNKTLMGQSADVKREQWLRAWNIKFSYLSPSDPSVTLWGTDDTRNSAVDFFNIGFNWMHGFIESTYTLNEHNTCHYFNSHWNIIEMHFFWGSFNSIKVNIQQTNCRIEDGNG